MLGCEVRLNQFMASNANLHLYQGDDYSAQVTVTSSDPSVPPAQILAGYTAQAQIRQDYADWSSTVIVEIGATVESPNITLSIPHVQTQGLAGNGMRWDLQVTAPDGAITTLIAGMVIVQSEVTREAASPDPPAAGDPLLISITVDGQALEPLGFTAVPSVVASLSYEALIAWTTEQPCVSVLMQVDNSFEQPWAIWTDNDYTPHTSRSVTVKLSASTTYRFAVMLQDSSGNGDPYQYPALHSNNWYTFKTPAIVTTGPQDWEERAAGSQHAYPGMELYIIATGHPKTGFAGSGNTWANVEDSEVVISPATAHITPHWLQGRADPPFSGGKHWLYYAITPTPGNGQPFLRLTIDSSCPAGTYTVTAPLHSYNGTVTRNLAWTFTVNAIPAITRPATIPTPAIPGIDKFWSTASTEGAKYNQPTDQIFGFGVESQVWFYDGCRVMLQVGDELDDGNPNWYLQSQNIAGQYANYIFNNGTIPGWRTFGPGLAMNWWRYGTATCRDALALMVNAAQTQANSLANVFPSPLVGYQRESALMLTAMVMNSHVSGVRHWYLDHGATIVAGHLAQLVQGGIFDQPFFDGISLDALMMCYEYDPAKTWIPAFVAWYQDYLWTWAAIDDPSAMSGGSSVYGWSVYNLIYSTLWPGLPKVNAIGTYHSGLNNLFCPAWAWLYNLTGNDVYRQRGDLMFEHHLDEAPWLGKQYSQTYEIGCDYAHYRSSPTVVKSLADPSNNAPAKKGRRC
jgi:hypothetical protein